MQTWKKQTNWTKAINLKFILYEKDGEQERKSWGEREWYETDGPGWKKWNKRIKRKELYLQNELKKRTKNQNEEKVCWKKKGRKEVGILQEGDGMLWVWK